jgi:tRNA-specific adenosine deaminase 1
MAPMMTMLERRRQWGGGYSFRPFAVETTGKEFYYSKRAVSGRAAKEKEGRRKMTSSNLAVTWTRNGVEEGLIGGIRQGRRANDRGAASDVSRRKMWLEARKVAAGLLDEGDKDDDNIQQLLLNVESYQSLKEGKLLECRRRVKEEVQKNALKGWTRNTGDEDFYIDHLRRGTACLLVGSIEDI